MLIEQIIEFQLRGPGSPGRTCSSVARGGAGGLEPPHWLVKYAKSHVFCAFEADFM